jgi:hypothetical protein
VIKPPPPCGTPLPPAAPIQIHIRLHNALLAVGDDVYESELGLLSLVRMDERAEGEQRAAALDARIAALERTVLLAPDKAALMRARLAERSAALFCQVCPPHRECIGRTLTLL